MHRWVALFLFVLLFCAGTALADAQENQAIIYTYLTEEMGLNRAAACGILSNIKSESNFRPEAIGDSGNAYGICQWNSRRNSLINYCENNGFESWMDIYGQLGYLDYELKNNKKTVGKYLDSIPDTAQGAYDAAWYFCVYFEIPANRYDKGVKRGKTAVTTYYTQYGGSINTYTITYNANGGKGVPAAAQKTEGVPFTVTSDAPIRVGYSLAGWSTDAKAVTVEYEAGALLEENRSLTLYAVWERSSDADTPADASQTLNGHTYEFYSGAFTWDKAKAFASQKGGYLASITTDAEAALVRQLMTNVSGNCWLGGVYKSGNWVWDSGESFSDAFASKYWASDEPCAVMGASTRGRLAVNSSGKWLDLESLTLNTAGLIIEYGEFTVEDRTQYRLTVSTSLNLREGPGTSYARLNYLYTDEIITVYEIDSSVDPAWCWCETESGKSGWCCMKIPDYMVAVGQMDGESGLYWTTCENGVCITGLARETDTVTIPQTLNGKPVVSIQSGAFTGTHIPTRIEVPACVTQIENSAFHSQTVISGVIASSAQLAAYRGGCAFDMVIPYPIFKPSGVLTCIEQDAFRASGIQIADLSFTQVSRIESGAFAECSDLLAVILPDSEISISPNAFESSVMFICPAGSPAFEWAFQNNFTVVTYNP